MQIFQTMMRVVLNAVLIAPVLAQAQAAAQPATGQQMAQNTGPAPTPTPTPTASPPATPAAGQGAQQIDAIVITGTKRNLTKEKTPDSVQVYTDRGLEQQGINNVREAFARTPNVDTSNAGFSIRGVVTNQRGIYVTKPAITFIRDGVEIDVVGANQLGGAWDLDQLEILRGTQANAYGRSAIGGAIVLKTKDPTFAFESEGRLGVGNRRNRVASAVVSGPLVGSELAGRLSFDTQRRESEIDSVYVGRTRSQYDELRGKLLYKPPFAPGWSALLTAEATRGAADQGGGGVLSGSGGADLLIQDGQAVRTEDLEEGSSPQSRSLSLKLEGKLSERWVFESITSAYDRQLGLSYRVLCFEPYRIGQPPVQRADTSSCLSGAGSWDGTTRSQEARLSFKDGAWSAMAGVYAQRQTMTLGYNDFAFDGTPLNADAGLDDLYNFKVDSRALFGEVGWEFAPQWTVTLAGRYNRETNRFGLFGEPGERNTYGKFTPQLTLTWQPQDRLTLLATAKRGFKAGAAEVIVGFADPAGAVPVREISRFKPEIADTAELGARWRSADNAWSLSANLYATRFKDKHEFIEYRDANGNPVYDRFDPSFTASATGNAATAQSRGLELEASWRAARGLDLYANLGHNRGRYRSFVAFGEDFSGQEFVDFPKFTANTGFTWRLQNGLSFALNANHRSRATASGEPGSTALPARTLFGGRIAYDADSWSVALAGINLADKTYRDRIEGELPGGLFENYGPRRFVQMELRVRY
jgi:outer membrane receptor protein involved in Fe transport